MWERERERGAESKYFKKNELLSTTIVFNLRENVPSHCVVVDVAFVIFLIIHAAECVREFFVHVERAKIEREKFSYKIERILFKFYFL